MGFIMPKRRSSARSKLPRRPVAPPPPEPASPSGLDRGGRLGWLPFVAIGVLAVGAVVFFMAVSGDNTVESAASAAVAAAQSPSAPAKPFPYYDSAEEARPFPVTLPPSTYSNETLQKAYQIAKEIPEILVQLPCLCGCHGVQTDHGSLLDCYVDDHAAT